PANRVALGGRQDCHGPGHDRFGSVDGNSGCHGGGQGETQGLKQTLHRMAPLGVVVDGAAGARFVAIFTIACSSTNRSSSCVDTSCRFAFNNRSIAWMSSVVEKFLAASAQRYRRHGLGSLPSLLFGKCAV